MGLLDAIRQASVPNKDGSSSTLKGAKSASCLSALLAVISTFRAGGNYELAFAEYANKYRLYASISQSLNAGRLLAPSTRLGIRARNLLFSKLSKVGPLMKLVDRPAAKLKLENDDRDISPGQYQPQRMSGLTAIFETQTNSVRLKSQSALRAAERASPCQAVP